MSIPTESSGSNPPALSDGSAAAGNHDVTDTAQFLYPAQEPFACHPPSTSLQTRYANPWAEVERTAHASKALGSR